MRAEIIIYFTILILLTSCTEESKLSSKPTSITHNCQNLSDQYKIQQTLRKEQQIYLQTINQTSPTTPSDIYKCAEDKECLFIPKNCNDFSAPISINSRYFDYYLNKTGKKCNQREIYDFIPPPEIAMKKWIQYYEGHGSYCNKNKCDIQKTTTQQKVYDCYFKTAISTRNSKLCNLTNRQNECKFEVAKKSGNATLCKEILSTYPTCYQEVICNLNNNDCKTKVKNQIQKDFPSISKDTGEYAICIYQSYTDEIHILDILNQKQINSYFEADYSEYRPSGSGGGGGGTAYLHCYNTITSAPVFSLTFNTLIPGADVDIGELIYGLYFNGKFYPYNSDKIQTARAGQRTIFSFQESIKTLPFNHELTSPNCQFNTSIYNEITTLAKSDLNLCNNTQQFLTEKNYYEYKNRCKDLLANNFRIKCLDTYALNNERYDLCPTLNCKIKTAPNLEVCKDIYPDTHAEQDSCRQVLSLELAKKTGNVSFCKNIPTEYADFNECLKPLAKNQKDVNICNELPIDQRRFNCYLDVFANDTTIQITPEITQCSEISGDNLVASIIRRNCEQVYALLTGNFSYCDSLGKGTAAENCRKEFKLRFKK